MSKLRLVNETRASAASPIPFIAPFEHELAPGAVIDALEGTSSTGHHLGGIDVEGVVGMDHGALRIKPLVQPGWGRSAVTWGPFEARCGLVASVLVLNGHNASENEEPWPSLARFVLQWTRHPGRRRRAPAPSRAPLRRAGRAHPPPAGLVAQPPGHRQWRHPGREPCRRAVRRSPRPPTGRPADRRSWCAPPARPTAGSTPVSGG
ncbi:MAG: hypothetical protein R2755_33580 [Acidimicrobiales bacterium]